MPPRRGVPIASRCAQSRTRLPVFEGVYVFRWFGDERGSVISEVTFGALCIGILVLGGLWVVAQLEGVSFQVLLQQIRNGS